MDNEIIEILKRLENKFDTFENKLNEHTLILRALEHSAEVNKSLA